MWGLQTLLGLHLNHLEFPYWLFAPLSQLPCLFASKACTCVSSLEGCPWLSAHLQTAGSIWEFTSLGQPFDDD